MWLRRLVGITMIITCIGMNVLVLVGFFAPDKSKHFAIVAQVSPAPTVTITAKPDATTAGSFSALTWTATGSPSSCTASDSWSGVKTPFGAESTGRISTVGNYKYTLSCKNAGGVGTATVTIAVGPANAAPPAAPAGNSNGSSSGTTTATYCGGATPCYGPNDVAKHGSSGNCWGSLGDSVFNVTGLDAGLHVAASGVKTIQVSSVCGKDLSAALNGGVSTPEYPSGHVHLAARRATDSNYAPYFVGYFDSSKP